MATWRLGPKPFRTPESILKPESGRRNFGAAASAMAVWPRRHGTKASPAAGCGEEQRQQAAAVHGRGWCQVVSLRSTTGCRLGFLRELDPPDQQTRSLLIDCDGGRGQRPGRRRPKRLAQPQAPWPRMKFADIQPPTTEHLVSSRRARQERGGANAPGLST